MNSGSPVVACRRIEQDDTSLADHLEALLGAFGGISQLVSAGDRVLLKPNWVAPFPQAVTDWELIVAVTELVRSVGAVPFIGESSGFEFDTDATFRALGLYEKAAAHDIDLVNLDCAEQVRASTPFAEIELARPVLDADAIISLPRLKRHSLTTVTAAQKNLFGMLSRASRRELHAKGLERGILAVNAVVRPAVHILDARQYLTRAVYGEPIHLGLLLASTDALALDHYAIRLLGHDPESIGYVRLALQATPASAHYRVVGTDPGGSVLSADSHAGLGYRLAFSWLYRVDHLLSRFVPHVSIIPYVHYWLGIRPHVVRSKCTACGDCALVCPVGAIHVDQTAHISVKRCMRLRCLRCTEVCREKAIEIRGARRPTW
jgi:uncharacterized protein (DUF362 family)/Pyruvate/2-oxoacid:ferredoxin oxidoreductase delta subunit